MKQDSTPDVDFNNQCDFDYNVVVKICIYKIDSVSIINDIDS